jgi:hypothetical protein
LAERILGEVLLGQPGKRVFLPLFGQGHCGARCPGADSLSKVI